MYAAASAPTSASSKSTCPGKSANRDRLAAPRSGELALVEPRRELLDHVPRCTESPEADAERAVAAEFDDLLLGEVLAQVVVDRVVDREVIGREELAVADRRALGLAEVRRFVGLLERADEI